MRFVNAHGTVDHVTSGSPLYPFLIVPLKAVELEDDGRMIGGRFLKITVRVGFQDEVISIVFLNLVFVNGTGAETGNKDLPYPRRP